MGGMLWIPISYLGGHTLLSKTITESGKGVQIGPKSVVVIFCLNAVGRGQGVKNITLHVILDVWPLLSTAECNNRLLCSARLVYSSQYNDQVRHVVYSAQYVILKRT